MIENLTVKSFENDSIFHLPLININKSVIGVGSFYEQTKIIDTNEFDFTFVLPYFNDSNIKVVKELCSTTSTCRHGFHKDPLVLVKLQYTGRDADILRENNLLTTFGSKTYVVACELHAYIKGRLRACLQAHSFPGIVKSTGKLEIKNDADIIPHGPALKLQLRWQNVCDDNLDISVDIVPAIQVTHHPLFKSVTAPHKMNRLLNPNDSYPFIPQYNDSLAVHFLISFVQIEIQLMDRLRLSKQQWFLCYLILKYIFWYDQSFNLNSTTNFFSSYVLKTLLFQEVFVCTNDDITVVECLLKMLATLQRYTTRYYTESKTHVTVNSIWFLDDVVACRSWNKAHEANELKAVDMYLGQIKNLVIDVDRSNSQHSKNKNNFKEIVQSFNCRC